MVSVPSVPGFRTSADIQRRNSDVVGPAFETTTMDTSDLYVTSEHRVEVRGAHLPKTARWGSRLGGGAQVNRKIKVSQPPFIREQI